MTIALVLAALLGLAAILAVALPFLREPEVRPEEDRLAGLDPTERRRLALLEERDRALAALSSWSSTTGRARSRTRTTASSSGRCGRVLRRR